VRRRRVQSVVRAFIGGFPLGIPGLSASGIIGSIISATLAAVVLLALIGVLKKAPEGGTCNQGYGFRRPSA